VAREVFESLYLGSVAFVVFPQLAEEKIAFPLPKFRERRLFTVSPCPLWVQLIDENDSQIGGHTLAARARRPAITTLFYVPKRREMRKIMMKQFSGEVSTSIIFLSGNFWKENSRSKVQSET